MVVAAPLALAAQDPNPLVEIAQDKLEKAVGAVTNYSVASFAREFADAAVEGEDRTLGAEMIAVNHDAAVLHELADQHVNLNTDPNAIAAKLHLKVLGDAMNANDLSNTDYILAMVIKHHDYAIEKLSWNALVNSAVNHLTEMVTESGFLGDLAEKTIGKSLAETGWEAFAARDRQMEPFVERYTAAADAEARERALAGLSAFDQKIRDDAYARALQEHPSQTLDVRHLMAATPVEAAAPAEPARAAEAPPTRGDYYADPVSLGLNTERGWLPGRRSSSPSDQEESRPAPDEPPPPSPEMQHERDCQGSGVMAGCEKYNSNPNIERSSGTNFFNTDGAGD